MRKSRVDYERIRVLEHECGLEQIGDTDDHCLLCRLTFRAVTRLRVDA